MGRIGLEQLTSVVERQMRRWELSFEIHDRLEQSRARTQIPAQVHPYVSIARQAGAQGSEVARLVAQKLGLELLDKELLDYMAQRYNLSKGRLEFVDEKECSWIAEVLTRWLDQRVVTQSEYVVHLGQVVMMTARAGSAVFVGRGAHFFLPREKGVCVWVVAPEERRIERIMAERSLSRKEAARYLEETDRGRVEFVQRCFRRDARDPLLYDLVIKTDRVPLETAADLIVEHYRRLCSGLEPVGPAPPATA